MYQRIMVSMVETMQLWVDIYIILVRIETTDKDIRLIIWLMWMVKI
jgi:hypothetical protein